MSEPRGSRMRKVNSLLKEVLAEEVERLKDPRLSFVTVTDVATSPDLRHAIVFFDTLDPGTADEAGAALAATARRLQSVVGRQTRLKFVPRLEFRVDTGIRDGERIEEILRQIQGGEHADD